MGILNKLQEEFVLKSVGKYATVAQLAQDASTRTYYRIHADGGTDYILCDDGELRAKDIANYAYKIVYDLFQKNGIPVPELYAWDRNGFLLIQDLGDDLLENVFHRLSVSQQQKIYQEATDVLISIHRIKKIKGLIPFSLAFDLDKLMYEFDFFIENTLCGYFAVDITEKENKELRDEFLKVSEILHKPELFILSHRDYISRNIMVHDGKPYVIDFQDARLGLPQYDLVSLLRDSSPQLGEELFIYLINHYYESAIENGLMKMSREQFEYYFDIMAFQRNVKALGTFGYQAFRKNRDKYVKYIRPTFNYLSSYAERRTELKKAYAILNRHIGGRL